MGAGPLTPRGPLCAVCVRAFEAMPSKPVLQPRTLTVKSQALPPIPLGLTDLTWAVPLAGVVVSLHLCPPTLLRGILTLKGGAYEALPTGLHHLQLDCSSSVSPGLPAAEPRPPHPSEQPRPSPRLPRASTPPSAIMRAASCFAVLLQPVGLPPHQAWKAYRRRSPCLECPSHG